MLLYDLRLLTGHAIQLRLNCSYMLLASSALHTCKAFYLIFLSCTVAIGCCPVHCPQQPASVSWLKLVNCRSLNKGLEELLKKWTGSKGVMEAVGGFSSTGEAGRRAVPACKKACMALKLHKLLMTLLHVSYWLLATCEEAGYVQLMLQLRQQLTTS